MCDVLKVLNLHTNTIQDRQNTHWFIFYKSCFLFFCADPPPGVLVLSPGSSLVLTCSGHVEVDGVKVSMARQGSNTNRGGTTGYTASPTTHTVWQTSVSRLLKDESDWEAKEMDGESDYEKEGDEGSRVTRGIKSRLQWKWNSRTVGKGDRDWGEITFERRRASLSLSSVRLTDSGRYSCYHRGRERFSLKVNVADPPENPSLSCYKRSPSSKIRCEWAPQKPITIKPNCYLLLSKSPAGAFHRSQCSYSSRRSRCWCALEHNWDELRTLHMAYLCVTSIAGNATSALRHFIPMDILKPDPPSDVSVRQEEGQEMRMTVNWSLPISWISMHCWLFWPETIKHLSDVSIHRIEDRSYTITDAIPGVEYLIQLRTRDEYDGQWSDWSTPASRWTGKHTYTHTHTHTHRKKGQAARKVVLETWKGLIRWTCKSLNFIASVLCDPPWTQTKVVMTT
uniref:Interleukin 6 receptor n=1 Tax=Sander lucioperca TaxID=283035 RepID=A0A8C9YE85_SANLU